MGRRRSIPQLTPALSAPRGREGRAAAGRGRPGLGKIQGERVLAEVEIGGQGAQQRGVLGGGAAAGPGEGDQQRVEPLARGAAAEDVEPVADLQFLDLAQQPVELAQGRRGSSPAAMPQSPSSPAARACSRIAAARIATRRRSPRLAS